jgi:hypothetical protein
VQRPVQVEADDPVEPPEHFGVDLLEHPASIHSSRRARNVERAHDDG